MADKTKVQAPRVLRPSLEERFMRVISGWLKRLKGHGGPGNIHARKQLEKLEKE